MSVHKRNELAIMAAASIPEAVSALYLAEQHVRANEPDEALERIRHALVHLERLKSPVVQAYRERAADEGGHLVGDED
jgi:cob(I)alamin adenosyltransferase